MPRSTVPILIAAVLLLVGGVLAALTGVGGDETGPTVAQGDESPTATEPTSDGGPEVTFPPDEDSPDETESPAATESPTSTASPAATETASPESTATAAADDGEAPDDGDEPGEPSDAETPDDEPGETDGDDRADEDREGPVAIDDLPDTGGGAPAVLTAMVALGGAIALRRR